MAEASDDGAASGEQRFRLQKIYLKDVSFESPAAPQIFLGSEDWQPRVELQVNTEHRHVGENLHEIVLTLTVSATQDERTAFLVEIKQAGLFQIAGLDGEALRYALASQCPAVLFPYGREVVSDLVAKGGLPQLVLQPINFDAAYARERARQEQGGAQDSAGAAEAGSPSEQA